MSDQDLKYKIRMGIILQFTVETSDPRLVLHLANGKVRECIEQNLDEGMLFKVFVTEVGGSKVENNYE